MTFNPALPQKRRAFETKITFLSGLRAKIAILVFAACWSTVGGWLLEVLLLTNRYYDLTMRFLVLNMIYRTVRP